MEQAHAYVGSMIKRTSTLRKEEAEFERIKNSKAK